MEKSSQHFGLDLFGTRIFSWPRSYTAYAPEVLLWWHSFLHLQYSVIHFCWGTKACSELSPWAFLPNFLITHPYAHKVTDFIFLGSKIIEAGDCSHEIKWHLLLGRKAMTNLDSLLKLETWLTDKGPYSQSYSFYSSHVLMWDLDHKEDWEPKNWCFWIVVLE